MEAEQLRGEVREFLAAEREAGGFETHADTRLSGGDPTFSRKLGERGWLGMTWPMECGGHKRAAMERNAVTEEMLAAGAPVAGHWIADRQSGPHLLTYGTERQRQEILPVSTAVADGVSRLGGPLMAWQVSLPKLDRMTADNALQQ